MRQRPAASPTPSKSSASTSAKTPAETPVESASPSTGPFATPLHPELDAAMRNILDTFSGADGAVGFTKFRDLVSQLDRQARDGDAAAGQVLSVIKQFSRLIDLAQRPIPPKPRSPR